MFVVAEKWGCKKMVSQNARNMGHVPLLWDGMRRPKFILTCVLLIIINAIVPSTVLAANSLSQFGITWTLDKELSTNGAPGTYHYGQFANGDYWVVGPIVLQSITVVPEAGNPPYPYYGTDRVRNGFIVNPPAGPTAAHIFDDRARGDFDTSYRPTLPMPVSADSSIVATISRYEGVAEHQVLKAAAVLTVLASPPPDGSFRPPYVGTNKPLYSSLNLRKDLLLNLPQPQDQPAPTLEELEQIYQITGRVWIDLAFDWSGLDDAPVDNMPTYGADVARAVGVATLFLLCDVPQEQKDIVLLRMVQIGIDNYWLVRNGQYWPANGGIAAGRKWPIIFAGLMLDDQQMKNIGDYPFPITNGFGEDCQTFYLTQHELDSYPESYATTQYYDPLPQLGDAVYGIRHCRADTPEAHEQAYREGANAQSWVGQVLSAKLMNVRELWNHDPLFDFVAWWMNVWVPADPSRRGNRGSLFADAMWYAYSATPVPDNTYHVTQTGAGNRSGSDWDNAFAGLPASLVRGGTYYVADGTYSGYTFDDPASGTEYITLKKATIADHGMDTGWQNSYGDGESVYDSIRFANTSCIVLDGQAGNGFKIQYKAVGGFVVEMANSSHITLRNCEVDGGALDGTAGACTLVHMGDSSYITVQDCDLHNADDDGIEIHSSNHLYLIGNEVHTLFGSTRGGCQAHSDGIEIMFSDGVEIKRNLIYDVRSTSALIIGDGGRGIPSYNIYLENNIFYTPESGFVAYAWNVNRLEIYNNVFWQGIYGGFAFGNDLLNIDVYNNVFHSVNYSHMGASYDPAQHRFGYNLVAVAGQGEPAFGSDTIIGEDPQFQNIPPIGGSALRQVTHEDFRLAAASPCINAGTAIGSAYDISGTPRPQGTAYDIGPYEHVLSDTTPPTTPQGLTAQAVSESQIDLSWQPSSDAGSGISHYNLYRNSQRIAQPTSTSFSDAGLNGGTLYTYNVSAVDRAGLESSWSSAASATTSADTAPPSIVSVSAYETSVEITFSEPLDTISAQRTENYSINNGISITGASLITNTVTLTTSVHTEGTYTLTVAGVEDTSGNPMAQTTRNYEYDDGLIGNWKLDDGSGTVAADSSGQGNPGTLINGPGWTTSGRINGALSFDGADDAVEVPTANFSATGGTIAMWASAANFAPTAKYLFGHASQPWSNRIQLYTDDTEGYLDLGLGDSHSRHTRIQNLDSQRWYHIALSWNGTNYVVYVDGAAGATGTYSGLSALETYADIGNNGDRSDRTEAFNGIIDEVRVYNRPLSPAEVAELYSAGGSQPDTHTLTVIAVNGSVTRTPDQTSYSHGEQVTLEAAPDTGYNFTNWSGHASGSANPITVIMDADKSVTANFAANTYTLNTIAQDGSVNRNPDKASYNYGETVTLQAVPNTGYHFVDWTGAVTGSTNPATVVMDADKSVTANFAVNTYTLSTTAQNGSVTKNPDKASYSHGETVTLQAVPNVGYHFANWTGAATGSSNPVAIVMDDDKSVTAAFAINTHTLDITAVYGSVVKTPDKTLYDYGETVTLQAVPNTGYSFVSWGGDAWGGGNPVTLTMDSNKSVTANFAYVLVDETPPAVAGCAPAPNSVQVPLNSLVVFHIADSGGGVDANTVVIDIGGNRIYEGDLTDSNTTYGYCARMGTRADYAFIYQASHLFDFDQTVNVTVNATDMAGNAMNHTYSFKTVMRSFGQNTQVSTVNSANPEGAAATAADSLGNIWAVWHTGTEGSRDIYVGRLEAGAETFGRSTQLTNNPADQCNASIAVDSADKLYVVWQDNRQGDWDICISTSADGINWSTETIVTDSNDDQVHPVIVVDNSSPPNAYIVWQDNRNGNWDIYVASSSNDFVTETEWQITSDSSDQTEPAVAVASDDTVYVVWMDTRGTSSDIYGAASDSGPWTNVPVVAGAGNQSDPAIATEAVGSVLHLVWVDDTSGNKDIYYASSNGLPGTPLSGTSIIDDTAGGTDQLAPVICVTGSTGAYLHVFTCWQDERNLATSGDADLYFAEIASGSGANVFVGDQGTNSDQTQPVIGADALGHPYLVWTDNRDGRPDIYYAGATYTNPAPLVLRYVSADIGGTVGDLSNISGPEDICVIIPAGACPTDVLVSISSLKNPPLVLNGIMAGYEIGPSGLEFSRPVTILIPYETSSSDSKVYTAYWFNPKSGALSQQGIVNIERIKISPTLRAVRFETTHFTQFFIAATASSTADGGGGGGGCSISRHNQGSLIEFMLPYLALTLVMVVIKHRDKRIRKARSDAASKC